MILIASCPMRGSSAVRMAPKFAELTVAVELTLVSSLDQLGWFRMLKYSARNCMLQRSLIWKFLTSPMSQLKVPGQRNCPLATLPGVGVALRLLKELILSKSVQARGFVIVGP